MKLQLTGGTTFSRSTVGSFVANLPELLGASLNDERCVVVTAEFTDGRYVQFWLQSWDCFVAEVISNRHLGSAVALSVASEARLREMGWSEPSDDCFPNWRQEGSSLEQLVRMVDSVRAIVFNVLGESPNSRVNIRTFESSRSNDASRGTVVSDDPQD